MYSTILEFSTLLILEMILGIDNLIFISLITEKLPINIQYKARVCGLILALMMRFTMLLGASYLLYINKKSLSFFGIDITYHNILLISGGMFLIYRSAKDIYGEIFPQKTLEVYKTSSLLHATTQIVCVDFVLSFDSVISGVGITNKIFLIGVVFCLYAAVALFLSKKVCAFVSKHCDMKIIALLFIGTLGIVLTLEGIGVAVSHYCLYSALAFSIGVSGVKYLKSRCGS